MHSKASTGSKGVPALIGHGGIWDGRVRGQTTAGRFHTARRPPGARYSTSLGPAPSPPPPRRCFLPERHQDAQLRTSGEDCRRKGGRAGPGSKVDTPEASSGPGWEIQEVSRVGAQGVTSKSKLLAREMPRVCSRGLVGLRQPRRLGEAQSSISRPTCRGGPFWLDSPAEATKPTHRRWRRPCGDLGHRL